MKNSNKLLVIIFVLSLIPNFLLIFNYNIDAGDYYVYKKVAINILNGCGVSLSDSPDECLPTFGGNQLPGYPFFLAFNYTILGINHFHKYIEALIYSLCILYFYDQFKFSNYIPVIVLALAPIHIGWARMGLTETLSTSLILLYFTLLFSASYKKFHIFILCILASLATYIRLDNIFLLIPTCYYIYSNFKGYKVKISVFILIFTIAIGLWGLRNISVGIDVFPNRMSFPANQYIPNGYIKWGSTWITREYERQGWAYPLVTRQYSTIDVSGSYKFYYESEIANYLSILKSKNNEEFPEEVDLAFSKLADSYIASNKLSYFLFTPLKRFMNLYTNVFSSYGLPLNINLGFDERKKLFEAPFSNIELIKSEFLKLAFKVLANFYKFMVLIAFAFLITKKHLRIYWITISLYLISKSLFLAYTNNVETRYIVPSLIPCEMLILLAFFANTDYRFSKPSCKKHIC
jgi:hypothetical protein